ncbi:MAG: PH domain-containing protein [bacterium]|nr:PH domain-containing protein [bacterium]
MFENKLKKLIKDDEQLITMVRKYLFVFSSQLTFGVIIIIASFFFLYPLFNWGLWGVLIFFIIILLGIFIIFRVVYVYSFNVFIITDQRIIDVDQRGFFDRIVSETTYEKIQDVSFRLKGMMQTILHYGSVVIQTAGNQANIELHGVKDPEKIHQIIVDIQREFAESNTMPIEEIKKMVSELKNDNKSNEEEE